jgi:hypothetical protein
MRACGIAIHVVSSRISQVKNCRSLRILHYERELFFADVFVPDGGVGANVAGKQCDAVLRIQIDYVDAQRTQPVDATLKITTFADHYGAKSKLSYQATAIPAGRDRGDHDQVAVTLLATGIAKCVSFSVYRRIAMLYATIVAGPDQVASGIEDGGANGNSAFFQAGARLFEGDGEHSVIVRG